ncbi:MAG: sensor histidine kinase [Thermoguttaceae bacterium]
MKQNDLDSWKERVALLEERLDSAERMTALGELASTTTHEFNNILMTILNYAKMGLRHNDEATRTKSLEKIVAAATRAAKITSTILGMARNRKGRYEPTDLVTLVEDTLFLLEREMTKYRIAIEKRFTAVPEVVIDGNQIQQVLINLMLNARQAMPDGGRLTIKVAFDRRSGMVDLVLRDYGTGIPADILPRIFEPHFSTKTVSDGSGVGGSGLGLASCKKIVEAHRGRLRVESSVGKGTAFTIKLPVLQAGASNDGVNAE